MVLKCRTVRLSPLAVNIPESRGYYLVYPPTLKQWPPLVALRRWLFDELERAKPAARRAQSNAKRTTTRGRKPSKDARRRKAKPAR